MTKYEKWKLYQYYIIIGVLSLITLFFLPMVGTEVGIAFILPNTAAGWVVYVITKLSVAAINLLIFHCFVKQAKVNIKDNEKFLQAQEILSVIDNKEDMPQSPKEFFKDIYGKKSIAVFMTSILSAIGLTQAILTYDAISMLTYLITVIFGVIFGVLQMNTVEAFWTDTYWRYAKKVEKDLAKAKEDVSMQGDANGDSDSGSNILDTSVVHSSDGADSGPVVVHTGGGGDSVLVSASDTGCSDTDNIDRGSEEDT